LPKSEFGSANYRWGYRVGRIAQPDEKVLWRSRKP
jgi:hypothetical protein